MFAGNALAACLAEVRSSVRRVRTYVFVVVAAAGIVATLVVASQATSSVAPLAGAYAPQFVLSTVGNAWLWLFLIATVFFAFDARQQDERARVAEVMDAKPTSNLALLIGRLAGTVLIAWLALVAIAVLVQAGGTVARTIHEAGSDETATLAWWLAVVVEPTSLATLLTIDAVPALAFAAVSRRAPRCDEQRFGQVRAVGEVPAGGIVRNDHHVQFEISLDQRAGLMPGGAGAYRGR